MGKASEKPRTKTRQHHLPQRLREVRTTVTNNLPGNQKLPMTPSNSHRVRAGRVLTPMNKYEKSTLQKTNKQCKGSG
jgi:hypothetical protein